MNADRHRSCESKRRYELACDLKKQLAHHLSTIEEYFRSNESLDQETFINFLRSCGVKLAESDLQLVIKACQTDDKRISCILFLKHFVPSIHSKQSKSHQDQCQIWNYVAKVSPLMQNIRSALARDFFCFDRTGRLVVPIDRALELMKKYGFPLNENQQRQLAILFSPKRDGQFHYFDFMQYFVPQSSQCAAVESHTFSRSTFFVQSKQSWTHQPVNIDSIFSRIRTRCQDQYQSLSRLFRMMDRHRTGLLDRNNFDHLLKHCQISLNSDELYHLMSDIDRDQDGKISYSELYQALIMDPLHLD